jgi:hypothetical protein
MVENVQLFLKLLEWSADPGATKTKDRQKH